MMQRQFLQQALTLADIEQRETPNDPYQAAPAKAFGFLNPQWQAFVARQPESCQWWSFTAEHHCLPGELEHIEGYATAVAGEPVDYFIAARWRSAKAMQPSHNGR
ncbi:hypothetical protein GCM10011297_10490 [Bacterioplanes sanyensis]|uniref:hypothetical protein n=1 Tax=Bacterioplanes sanyensis TaxID=1249553 RepID=UPI00167998BE|nr:hypothetical protein [Bacterioplanes sanyensis]GGY39188.1 hypothetical protein GCM10011297_10490 [Bacterioplanes sanyensis]